MNNKSKEKYDFYQECQRREQEKKALIRLWSLAMVIINLMYFGGILDPHTTTIAINLTPLYIVVFLAIWYKLSKLLK